MRGEIRAIAANRRSGRTMERRDLGAAPPERPNRRASDEPGTAEDEDSQPAAFTVRGARPATRLNTSGFTVIEISAPATTRL